MKERDVGTKIKFLEAGNHELESNENVAFLLPGQGNIRKGMCFDLAQSSGTALKVFKEAEKILGKSIFDLENENEAGRTDPAQVILFVYYHACYQIAKEKFNIKPKFFAGHSLGEIIAFVEAGSISFKDGLLLVSKRGELMQMACDREKTGMVAVRANPEKKLSSRQRKLMEKAKQRLTASGRVTISAYNSPDEFVIAGRNDDLEISGGIISKEFEPYGIYGTRLNMGGAFHSDYMKPVESLYENLVNPMQIKEAQIPVIANSTAEPITHPAQIREELISQLTKPVLWWQSIQRLWQEGTTAVVELGENGNLTNYIIKSDENRKNNKVRFAALGGAALVTVLYVLYRGSRKQN